jgi:hypothetical protein
MSKSAPTTYNSGSKGVVKIADMNEHHLAGAIGKLARAKARSQMDDETLAALINEQTKRGGPPKKEAKA